MSQAELQDLFSQIDTNNDGAISRQELDTFCAQPVAKPSMQIPAINPALLQGVLQQAVKDAVGGAMSAEVDRSIEEMRREMQRRSDEETKLSNQVSELWKTISSLRETVKQKGEAGAEEATEAEIIESDNFFKMLDSNKDGVISREEFMLAFETGLIEAMPG